MLPFALILACYLLGSINFSVIIGKLLTGVDVRNHGSGNAGTTNTLRVIGKGPAILVLILDIGKGVLAVWLARWLAPDDYWLAVVCGLSVVTGHNWPVWFRFRGGKGIATTLGMIFSLAFVPALFAAIVAVITIVLTRYVSLGSLLATALLPIFVYWLHDSTALLWGSIVILVFAWFKHRKNIQKLLRGTENKLGSKSKS